MKAKVLVYKDEELVKVYEGNLLDIVAAVATDKYGGRRVRAATLFGIGALLDDQDVVLAPNSLPDGAYDYNPFWGFLPRTGKLDFEVTYLDKDGKPLHPLVLVLGGPTLIGGMASSVDVKGYGEAKKVEVEEGSGYTMPKQWAVVPAEDRNGTSVFKASEATYVDTLTEALRKADITRPVDYAKAMTIGFGYGKKLAIFAGEPSFAGTFARAGDITGYDLRRAIAQEDWKFVFE